MSLLRTRSRSKNVRLYFSLDEGFHAIAPASIESARLPSRLRSRRFPITRRIHFADRARAETRTSLHSKSLLTACTIHARLNFIYVHAHSRDFQSYQKEKERKREKEKEKLARAISQTRRPPFTLPAPFSLLDVQSFGMLQFSFEYILLLLFQF